MSAPQHTWETLPNPFRTPDTATPEGAAPGPSPDSAPHVTARPGPTRPRPTSLPRDGGRTGPTPEGFRRRTLIITGPPRLSP